jgi:hypothetical protein
MLNPTPAFDCLSIVDVLSKDEGSISAPEIQLFAYLSCLLWLFRGRTVATWGYQFVGTEYGAPYSRDIDATLKELHSRGYLLQVEARYRLGTEASAMIGAFQGLSINRPRLECLDAACSSTIALSPGLVGSALSQEPELSRARALPMSRPLLEPPARARLHSQFIALRQGLADNTHDLRVPAVVWLSALYRTGDS